MTERILIIRIAGIGDVAVASTVLDRLRAEQPGARITWLCGTSAAPLVRLYGVDEVIVVDEAALFRGSLLLRVKTILSLWGQLLRRGYDRVLLLHVDSRYRVLVVPLIGARVSALSRARHGSMIPVPGRWLGDEYARLVTGTAHVGPIHRHYEMADLRSRLTLASRTGSRPRIALVPGGARNVLREDALKRWPVTHYAELAALLIEAGLSVVLVGSKDDAWVTPAFTGLTVENRIGMLDLVETLAVLGESDLVISHDTGPMHLARLVRVPLVAIFGPTIPAHILSIDDSVTILWGGAELACRPCYDGREFAACRTNICMSSVTPHQVLTAALDRLSQKISPTHEQPTPQIRRET